MPDALSQPYLVRPEQIEHYREYGWAYLPGLCPPETIAQYRKAIVSAARRLNRETRPLEERDTYGKAFLQIMNLWIQDEAVKPFVLSRRFAQVAAELTGAASIRLYHDQALFKEPGGGPTPWHQDQFYWPLETTQAITMWMPLVDVSEVMGSMTFANGSQKEGFIPLDHQISDESDAFFDRYIAERHYPLAGAGAMSAGDATFHGGWTLHRAPGNVTDVVREVMTMIYFPDGARVAEPQNDFQKADQEAWLGGVRAGSAADGPLNPVLYP